MNQNSKVAGCEKRTAELKGTVEPGDNSMWVCHYKRPLSLYMKSSDSLVM